MSENLDRRLALGDGCFCFVLFAILLCAGAPNGGVFASCVLNDPDILEVALINQPIDGNPSIQCPPPPDPPCLIPAPPTIDPDSEHAQGLTLNATIPLDQNGVPYPANVAVWVVAKKNIVGGQDNWEQFSTVVSTDSIANKNGQNVRFGVAGLEPGEVFRFQVGFCESHVSAPEVRTCTCWSDPSGEEAMDTPFAASGPSIPANISQEAEDRFERPSTTGVESGGDGVGPENVWLNRVSPGASPAWIVESEGAAFLRPSAQLQYLASLATDTHNYAEFKVRKIPDGLSTYNLQLIGRRQLEGTVLKFYIVKLVNGHRDWNEPTLAIGRWDEQIRAGAVPSITLPNGVGTCTAAPPFGGGTPVWLRFETYNEGDDPVVIGSVIC